MIVQDILDKKFGDRNGRAGINRTRFSEHEIGQVKQVFRVACTDYPT